MLRKKEALSAKCAWLIDSQKNSLATLFRITNIPTMVIISPSGKVLFNGHPSDENFWHTLTKIDPKIKRPQKQPHQHSDVIPELQN